MSFTAKITADITKFEQNIGKAIDSTNRLENTVSAKLSKMGDSFVNVGKKASILSAALVAAGGKAFMMAADFEDAIGATGQIFSDNADIVRGWADTLGTEYGIAKKEALEYSNLMGSMLINIGKLTEEQAARQSAKLIELAGDLTAMYGGRTQDAVRALMGALKGNNTMLDNYGMAVNDALVKTRAFEMGLSDGTGELSLQAKQAATLALIYEQTTAAQGQAAREADGASGSMRALTTEVKNLSTELGQVLIPVITPIVTGIRDMVAGLRTLSPEMQTLIVGVAGVTAAIGPAMIIIGKVLKMLPAIKVAIAALSGPVGAITLAIVGLTAGIVYFVNRANEATTASEALAEVNNRVEASVRREIAELNKLISVARDETKAKETRLEAIRKINAISPEHLGFIELETVNTDAATNAVNSYTTAIKENARQKAISDKISKLYSAQLDYEEKIARETQKIEEDKAKGWLASNFILRSAFKTRRAEFQRELDNINASIEAHESLAEQYVKTGETGATGTAKVLTENEKLIASLNKQIEDLKKQLSGLPEKAKEAAVSIANIAKTKIIIPKEQQASMFDQLFSKDDGNLTLKPVIEPTIDVKGLKEKLRDTTYGALADLGEGIKVMTINMTSMVTDIIDSAFSGIADAIANKENVVASLGASLLAPLGNILSQLGKMLITTGAGFEALQKMFANPFGGGLGAIAAGVALMALGAAAKAGASAIMANQNKSSGYSSAPSMGNTSPSYGPSEYRGAYQDDFEVTFKIGTNELVGVLNTAEQRRNRI